MNIDGVFLHHLINEVKPTIEGMRINKFIVINQNEFAFLLQNKTYLYFCLNSNSPHFRLTKKEITKSDKNTPFYAVLKKYCESSIINSISQYDNDRIAIIDITHFDELGYTSNIKLIIELFGRNSNAILTNSDYIIIDCFKRLLPNEDDLRILLPKVEYKFEKSQLINPFIEQGNLITNSFNGVSNLCFNEMQFVKNQDIIKQNTNPSLIKSSNKVYFYAFPLTYLNGEIIKYDTLSNLLEYYYYDLKAENHASDEQNIINNYLFKAIKRCEAKLIKQQKEIQEAQDNLIYEKIGNLLANNLHLIKKQDTKIIVNDFYNNNEEITISLNPQLSPSDNLNYYFNKYKKAKRSLEVINEQIENTKKEIDYYNCLLEQVKISKNQDLREILDELKIKKTSTAKAKKLLPNITIYEDDKGNRIYVGKNNIQNNYLTNSFAKNDDIFFHTQGYSGSHTILRSTNPTMDIIEMAAMVAAYYSQSRNSSNVAVDYVLKKYVKKVPGTFGSFVTYTNQKTIFVTPKIEIIEKKLKKIK